MTESIQAAMIYLDDAPAVAVIAYVVGLGAIFGFGFAMAFWMESRSLRRRSGEDDR